MSNQSVEDIKISSIGLRGTLAETLQSEATHFSDEEYQLLKFHGSYQQDDRDIRAERRKQKLDKLWSFMIRSKMPGGRINAAQYLMHDRLAGDVANGTLRLTTRQGIQFHGVFKGDLKEVIAGICESGLTTWGACGDVVRNTMGPASPIHDVAHPDCQALAEEMSAVFLPRSSAYSEIWLDGEKLELSSGKAEPDEIYGETYLPRKFKIGMAVPPRNDVDIFSQDVGMVPHVNAAGDAVEGYSIWVGGGFGMTHNMEHTRPHLAKPLYYAARADVLAVVKAVVQVQREHGNRTDRKLSRLKYVVAGQGIEWFRDRVAEKLPGVTLAPVREVRFTTVGDRLGWHEQGDGNWFRGFHVPQGRILDVEGGTRFRTAFREAAEQFGKPYVVTPNANLILCDVAESEKAAIDALFAQHLFPNDEAYTEARKTGHACVALPTCGLSLAESERVFTGLLDDVDRVLHDLGLEREPLLIRMTGCPNGCARPYNADIAFVGRAPKKYAMYVGGSCAGDRLAGLFRRTVEFHEIPEVIRGLLVDFVKDRHEGETFTAYWGRTQEAGEEPDALHFHKELVERTARLEGTKTTAAE